MPRNVVNVDEVDAFVADIARTIERPLLANWVRTQVRRWVLREHDDLSIVLRLSESGELARLRPALGDDDMGREPHPLTPDQQPDWLAGAVKRGDVVVWLHINGTLRSRVRRVIDYLEATLCPDHEGQFGRLGFAAAEDAMRQWRRERYLARMPDRPGSGEPPVYQGPDGFSIIRLNTAEALRDEGEHMRHCSYDYREDVAEGLADIYSLRGRAGESVATIEVRGGRVWQVKGFANGIVPPRCRPHVRNFIRAHGYSLEDDHGNVGLIFAVDRDYNDINTYLESEDGLQALEAARYTGDDPVGEADALMVTSLLELYADDITPANKVMALDTLMPVPEAPITVARDRVLDIHGLTFTVHRVTVPGPILSIDWHRAFGNWAMPSARAKLRSDAEDQLSALAFEDLTNLYDLGSRWSGIGDAPRRWFNAADIMVKSRLDLRSTVRRRHNAIRARANRRKEKFLGKSQARSPQHQELGRLLSTSHPRLII